MQKTVVERIREMYCEKYPPVHVDLLLERVHGQGCRLPLKDEKDWKMNSPSESLEWWTCRERGFRSQITRAVRK